MIQQVALAAGSEQPLDQGVDLLFEKADYFLLVGVFAGQAGDLFFGRFDKGDGSISRTNY